MEKIAMFEQQRRKAMKKKFYAKIYVHAHDLTMGVGGLLFIREYIAAIMMGGAISALFILQAIAETAE